MTETAVKEVEVKFYDKEKGFGFFQTSNTSDLFVHASVAEAYVDQLIAGQRATVEYRSTDKGLQVTKIISLEVDGVASLKEHPPERFITGVVKSFFHDRGYGFINADGFSGDVFISAEVAGKVKHSLKAGVRVRFMMNTSAPKLRASAISLI